MENSNGGESRIRKVLFNEVALFAGFVGILFGIFNLLQSPKNEIEIIKTLDNLRDNHIHTIEVKLGDQATKLNEMHTQLIRLETLLEERLPNE